MEKLDLKDRKILYELDIDSRQSFRSIGRKVGLSKDVVASRVKRLEEEGIIKSYWTEINTFKLGFNCYKLYLSFQDTSPDKKDEIIKYFTNNRYAWAVISSKGPYDLDVMLWINDSHEFDLYWNTTLDKYGIYFSKQKVVILTGGVAFKKSYLLLDEYDKTDMVHFILRSGGRTVDIDKIDYIILNELAYNARIPMIELADKTKCSSQTIRNKIKNLIKNNIILVFRISIDTSKIHYLNPGLDIYLKEHTKRKQIISFLMKLPNVEYIVEGIGGADIELSLVVKNLRFLTKIIEDIDNMFPGSIRKQEIWYDRKFHRLRMLPEIKY
jgi:DNA-binding Lrp family transcriptional regulator